MSAEGNSTYAKVHELDGSEAFQRAAAEELAGDIVKILPYAAGAVAGAALALRKLVQKG